jgi:hypothetical protein
MRSRARKASGQGQAAKGLEGIAWLQMPSALRRYRLKSDISQQLRRYYFNSCSRTLFVG